VARSPAQVALTTKENNNNSITHGGSVQILLAMACWKALGISHLPKKFQKIYLLIGITVPCPITLNSTYGTPSPLGINDNKPLVSLLYSRNLVLALLFINETRIQRSNYKTYIFF
jgi:hypothetical protein